MMANYVKYLCAFLSAIMLASCSSFPALFSEDDAFIVNTPEYADNRVFYLYDPCILKDTNNPSEYENCDTNKGLPSPLVELQPGYAPTQHSGYAVHHGKPLTIVVSSASLPPSTRSTTMDIALIVDVGTANDGSRQQYAVWYQRGVTPDQLLNFSNIILHFEPEWDSRVAPLFRIRLIDVTTERNLETIQALNRVKEWSSVALLAAPNPATVPTLNTAANAAKLVVANNENQPLLDYTVQFYSDEQANAAPGSTLTRIRRGSFFLFGRKTMGEGRQARDVFGGKFQFDRGSDTLFWQQKTGTNTYSQQLEIFPSPYIKMSVLDADVVVPSIVADRSIAITNRLTNAANKISEQDEAAVEDLACDLKALRVVNSVLGPKSVAGVDELLREIERTKGSDSSGTCISRQRATWLRTLTKISGCSISSPEEALQWRQANWTASENRSFKSDALQLSNYGQGCLDIEVEQEEQEEPPASDASDDGETTDTEE